MVESRESVVGPRSEPLRPRGTSLATFSVELLHQDGYRSATCYHQKSSSPACTDASWSRCGWSRISWTRRATCQRRLKMCRRRSTCSSPPEKPSLPVWPTRSYQSRPLDTDICDRWKCSCANTGQTEAAGQGFTGPGQLGHQGHLLGPQGLFQSSR